MMRKAFLGLSLAALIAGAAWAQSSPGYYNGQTLTAGDLNSAFAGKLDVGASSLLSGANSWTGAQTFQGAATFTGTVSTTAPVTVSTTTYTVGASDSYLICTSATGCTVTLPAASGAKGRALMIKTAGGGAVTSASANVVPLAGGSAATAVLASTAGKWGLFVSDATSWVQMAGN